LRNPSILSAAAEVGQAAVLGFLIENGIKPRWCPPSVIRIAVDRGYTRFLELLIAGQMAPEIAEEDMVAAVRSGRLDILEMLLLESERQGKPLEESYMETAVEEDKRDVILLLLRHGMRRLPSARTIADRQGNPDLAIWLTEHGFP
jgi:hypothetical protein